MNPNDTEAILQNICDVLKRHADAALENRPAETVAREWLGAGFDDPEEIDDWLRARCFRAAGAQKLERAGITPEQAAIPTTEGTSDYEDTIGYKTTRGDLGLDEARRIVTGQFWNT